MKLKLNKLVINLICSLLVLVILYHPTILYLDADSYEYFGIVKTIWHQNGSYWDWTTAAGYNHFSLNYLLTLVVGVFTHNSAINFFWLNNFIEVILFYSGCDLLYKAVYQKSNKLIFPVIVIWLSIYSLSNGLYNYIFASDLFLLLYDAVFLMMLAWQIKLLRANAPLSKYFLFFVINLYLSATNLRYCSISMLLLIFNQVLFSYFFGVILNKKRLAVTTSILLAEIVIGYFLKAALDLYPTDAIYFTQLSTSLATIHAFTTKLTIFTNSFQFINIWGLLNNSLFFVACAIIFYVGLTALTSKKANKPTAYLFTLTLTIIVLLTVILIIKPSNVFNSQTYEGMRYYEIAIVFVSITFIFWLVNLVIINKFQFIVVILAFLFAAYLLSYFKGYDKIKYDSTLQCINANKTQYNLQDGLGSYYVGRYLSLSMESNDVYAFATPNNHPTNFAYGWLTNIYPKPNQQVNYAVINNQQYHDLLFNQLNQFSSKVEVSKVIPCGGDFQLVRLSDKYAKELTNILLQQAANYRASFIFYNLSATQTVWHAMPWHKTYQQVNTQKLYWGNMLYKNNTSVTYSNESNLAVNISYRDLPTYSLIAMDTNSIVYSDNAKITLKIKYSSSAQLIVTTFDVFNQISYDSHEVESGNNHEVEFPLKIVNSKPYSIGIINTVADGLVKIDSLTIVNH